MCLQNRGLGFTPAKSRGLCGQDFYSALPAGRILPFFSAPFLRRRMCWENTVKFHCSSCDFVSQTCKGMNRHQHVPFVLFLLAWGAPNPCPKLGREERNPFSMGSPHCLSAPRESVFSPAGLQLTPFSSQLCLMGPAFPSTSRVGCARKARLRHRAACRARWERISAVTSPRANSALGPLSRKGGG